jgi:hypothetical protein
VGFVDKAVVRLYDSLLRRIFRLTAQLGVDLARQQHARRHMMGFREPGYIAGQTLYQHGADIDGR